MTIKMEIVRDDKAVEVSVDVSPDGIPQHRGYQPDGMSLPLTQAEQGFAENLALEKTEKGTR